MTKNESVTVQILKQIRDEVAGVRAEVRDVKNELRESRVELGTKIDETNARVERLARRQTESEMRLAIEVVAVSRAVNDVRDLLRERLDERVRVNDHERRITALERRPRSAR